MRVLVGRVIRAHGLRGDVLVAPSSDDPHRRFAAGSVLLTDDRTLTVDAAAPHGGRWRVRFREVPDRDAAEALRGLALHVDTEDLERGTDPDDFHDVELIGLAVETADGRRIGEVGDVLHPAQDVLVVTRPDGPPAYVPFVKALVPTVDVAAGRLVVDLPPGLVDADRAEEG